MPFRSFTSCCSLCVFLDSLEGRALRTRWAQEIATASRRGAFNLPAGHPFLRFSGARVFVPPDVRDHAVLPREYERFRIPGQRDPISQFEEVADDAAMDVDGEEPGTSDKKGKKKAKGGKKGPRK